MARDRITVGIENNTKKQEVQVTVTIDHALFVTDTALCVFYGLPPSYTPPHPVTEYMSFSNKLIFEGNINSLYCELDVDANDNRVYGTITVQPALPVSVYISSIGGHGSFELPAGQTSATFKLPIADAPQGSESEGKSRLAKVLNKSE